MCRFATGSPSKQLCSHGPLAQLVEQLTLNQRVASSILARLTIQYAGAVSSRQPMRRSCLLLTALFVIDSRCESGGTGRRARLRIWWATVGVQVPPLAPNQQIIY